MKEYQVKVSTNPNDIKKILQIVKTFGGNAEELKKIRGYIEKELAELGDNRLLFILSNNAEVIAATQLLIRNADSDPELADGQSVGHIHALQVAKHFQRQGYGSSMMKEVECYARKNGILKLTLGVDENNPKARGLYDKLNYKLLKEEQGRTLEFKLFYLYKELK